MVNKLSQTDRRCQYRDGIFIPFTTDRPVAPTSELRIVSCGCKDRLSENILVSKGMVVLLTNVLSL